MADMLAAPVPPELAHLSKRQLKREMRRRVHEANKQDEGWRQKKLKARAATREAARLEAAESAPQSVNADEKISQHRPYGNKPAAGFVIIPVESAANLNVAISGCSHHHNTAAEESIWASIDNGEGEGDEVHHARATRGAGQRLVALHHETVRSVAMGLSAHRDDLAEYMKAACGTRVESIMRAPGSSTALFTSNGAGGGGSADDGAGSSSSASAIVDGGAGPDNTLMDSESDRGELSLEAFREYYMLREQARDRVKEMIQQDNPGHYEHVTHIMHN